MGTHARRAVAAAAVLVALLSACGDSGGSDAAPRSSSTTTEATTSGSSRSPGGDEVSIEGFAFDPDDLEVEAGTTVTFTNADPDEHTATADDDAPTAFDTGDIESDGTAEVTFDEPGDYSYHCSIHEYMKGTIRVIE